MTDHGSIRLSSFSCKVGVQAVLFYSGPTRNALISTPLLPKTWKQGDALISIPVLAITRSLGLTLLENQSNVHLSLKTNVLVETPDKPTGDDGDNGDKNVGIIGRIGAAIGKFWDGVKNALAAPWVALREKWNDLWKKTPKEGDGDNDKDKDKDKDDDSDDDGGNGNDGDGDNDNNNEGFFDKIKAAFGRFWNDFLAGPWVWIKETSIDLWTKASPYLGCGLKVSPYGIAGAVIGAIGLPLTLCLIPVALGFGVEGIYAASCAATCMACHGGYTPAGGFVATMQSIGTLGFFAGFNIVTLIIGAVAGLAGGGYYGVAYVGMCPELSS